LAGGGSCRSAPGYIWHDESTGLGPFFVPNSPLREYGANIASQPAGDPTWVFGRVLTTEGDPIAGAELDVWQNGDNELYAVQDPHAPEDHLRARFETREDGTYGSIGVGPSRTGSRPTVRWDGCSMRPASPLAIGR
jgi:protocatechuate 3,4-dioxygenase beta subunit